MGKHKLMYFLSKKSWCIWYKFWTKYINFCWSIFFTYIL